MKANPFSVGLFQNVGRIIIIKLWFIFFICLIDFKWMIVSTFQNKNKAVKLQHITTVTEVWFGNSFLHKQYFIDYVIQNICMKPNTKGASN